MPGSACIYYGTEIGMEAANDLDCRRPMPWKDVEAGTYAEDFRQVQALIALRTGHPQLRRGDVNWQLTDEYPRLVRYTRTLEEETEIAVWVNAGDTAVTVNAGNLLFSRNLEGASLLPGGIAVFEV